MTDGDSYRAELILAIPCPTCGKFKSPSPFGTCTSCNSPLPTDLVTTVRDAIKLRRQTFKGRLLRLEERMHAVEAEASKFAIRGVPLAPEEHRDRVVLPLIEELPARSTAVARLLASTQWDDQTGDRIDAFNELIGLLDAGLTSVVKFCKIMPPLEWRAVHRELAHATMSQLRGQIKIVQTLSAPDVDSAQRLQEEGQRSLDTGVLHAERVTKLVERVNNAPSDSPFQADGSLDIAMLAWGSVSQKPTTISDGAEIIREAYSGAPGVETLPDHYGVLLLPLLAVSAQVADHQLLISRTQQLRQVLDDADRSTSWVVEPELLVGRILHGLEEITNATERLGREWRHGLPRSHIMNSLAEVYRHLIESAFLDLGGIILTAARANRGDADGLYEEAVVDGIKAGEVADEFGHMGGPCSNAVDMLYRNANAHAGFKITDTGIVATERRIKDSRVEKSTTVVLSDAEFAEEIVSLQEILLALQLTVLPWAWSDANSDVSAIMASMRPGPTQTAHTVALLGGMVGLIDIEVSVTDGHFAVIGRLLPSDSDRREIGILSLVPVAFSSAMDVSWVSLSIDGLRPVEFERSEFESSDTAESPHKLPMLALTTAKWLIQSGGPWSLRDEATYVSFPLTMVHFAAMQLAGSTSPSTKNIDSAVKSLRLVRSRLNEVLPAGMRSPLTKRAVAQVDTLAKCLAGLANARRGVPQRGGTQKLAQDAAATGDLMYVIQEEAKALRDQTPSGD